MNLNRRTDTAAQSRNVPLEIKNRLSGKKHILQVMAPPCELLSQFETPDQFPQANTEIRQFLGKFSVVKGLCYRLNWPPDSAKNR